ncbi:MAG TPA: ATP-binding protein [Streptosporangiaceae bacterium]|nr:ATP-binding protein [Streptosporangiaceae bacterium]
MRTAGARPIAGPPIGSAWQPPRPGHPRPLNAGTLSLTPLPTSPGFARQYTRFFLDSCRGLSEDAAETAVLLVSELVTNAVRFAAGADASLIRLSIRHFRDGLLIEVGDASSDPPARSGAGQDAEGGRGLAIIDALSKEWSYFPVPDGGKVVYCVLETP